MPSYAFIQGFSQKSESVHDSGRLFLRILLSLWRSRASQPEYFPEALLEYFPAGIFPRKTFQKNLPDIHREYIGVLPSRGMLQKLIIQKLIIQKLIIQKLTFNFFALSGCALAGRGLKYPA